MIYDVQEFHEGLSHPVGKTPMLLSSDRMKIRQRWIKSEFDETEIAFDEDNIAKVFDGIADQIYFLLGTAVEMGGGVMDNKGVVLFDRIWAVIQKANMGKMNYPHIDGCASELGGFCDCGAVAYDENGKVIKPNGWKAPDEEIRQLVKSAIEEGWR